ncbi:MAG: hypothetical protein HMLKMBBP_03063 [Planctomycetes bacterium]|nr:hypothetical protein [Planctomycetota bacterium]
MNGQKTGRSNSGRGPASVLNVLGRNAFTVKALGGCAVAAVAAAALAPREAEAARAGSFIPLAINVGFTADVPCNQIIEAKFSAPVDPTSIGPATLYVREANATGTGYTIQVAGTYQVAGSVVRFFPRLPGHLRDPGTGNFYMEGTALDNAGDNAAFQPSKQYQVFYVGKPAVTTIRSTRGKPLRTNYFSNFSTAAALSPDTQYTTKTFADAPPPEAAFANPADAFPTAASQYVTFGGTRGVPNDIGVSVFCTKIPLSPSTARVQGNVELTVVARSGAPVLRRPVPGSVFVEQNFQTTLLQFRPRFALSDQGTYVLRISKNVRDLTEQYDFKANRSRERLRQIYDFLVSQRAALPGVPAAQLPDPAPALIGDWPSDAASRGTLKANILALGDAHPEEFDPRVMVIFTTRDEPVTNAELVVEFLKTDGLYDGKLSTGEWDAGIPDAASAINTIAGGSAANGDFAPTANTSINTDTYPGNVINFRNVSIPNGVTITLTGTRPATIKAIDFTLDGVIDASGRPGSQGSNSSSLPSSSNTPRGGAGGPGGGAGGNGSHLFPSTNGQQGNTGNRGGDSDGAAPSTFGGFGGLGGFQPTGTYAYAYGGGGGGGGQRLAGRDGTAGSYPSYASWNGALGRGGAASTNTTLTPLPGGSGGGSGGHGSNTWAVGSYGNYTMGAGGGGGGGAILIQTARVIRIGSTGRIRCNGGAGGAGFPHPYSGGAAGGGGGGSGGSILLRSTSGFNIANPAASFELNGGAGGALAGAYGGAGGAGGAGFLRTEDPAGGVALPNGTQGVFDPVGGGVPSFVYSKWADLGVQDPRVLPWTNADIVTNPTANDAILVECQMTRESQLVFDTPDTTYLDSFQNTTDANQTSPWIPIKIHDRTNKPGGAFQPAGWSPTANGSEFSGFPVTALNGRGFRFIRFRITFQLDDFHARTDPTPHVESLTTHFQFNL